MPEFLIAAFYKFVPLPDYEAVKGPLLQQCLDAELRGTILLAAEGINGTIAGKPDRIHAVLGWLRNDERFADLAHKESFADDQPFQRMKVRLKKEIVTMGVKDVDPLRTVGTYVDADRWNALISDPDVAVVDVRNDYEVALGTFDNAINPEISCFRDFPKWVEESGALEGKSRVAMFCTGGIRCEKATSYLKDRGIEEVFHLEGGVLRYFEETPEADSLWRGECFVFDDRITVNHRLEPGSCDAEEISQTKKFK